MTPHRRRSAHRRLAIITAGAIASAALAWGPASPADAARHPETQRAMPGAPGAPAPPPAPTDDARAYSVADVRRAAFGAFLDSEPEGLVRLREFSGWLGGTELRVGHTYLPGDVWGNIEGGYGFLDS